MDQLLKQVKQESQKLVDINSVLMKLNDKGYVQQIAGLFETIFQEEQSFTIQELTRLMKNLSKDKYFDMNMQFKMNTSIFKANFEVITGIIIDNIWKKVSDDFSQSLQAENPQPVPLTQQNQIDPAQQNPQASENQASAEQQQQQQQQSPQYVEEEQQQQIQQNYQNQQTPQQQPNQQSNRQQQNQSLYSNANNTSYNQINNNPNDSWVRKSMKQSKEKSNSINKSAMDLYDGRRSQVLQRNQNISFSQLSGKKKSNPQNTSKMSISSVRSMGSVSKIGNTPVPFSEISGIHEQSQFRSASPNLNSSFSRAPRDIDRDNYEQSPGPSDYNLNRSINQIRKQSPNTKFGKSERISWIDERLRYDSSVQSPGAKYDAVKLHTSKKPKSMSKK